MYEIDTPIEFGQYRGISINKIAEKDIGYIIWCINNVGKFDLSYNAILYLSNKYDTFRIKQEEYSIIFKRKLLLNSNPHLQSTIYRFQRLNGELPLCEYTSLNESFFGEIFSSYKEHIDSFIYGRPIRHFESHEEYLEYCELNNDNYNPLDSSDFDNDYTEWM